MDKQNETPGAVYERRTLKALKLSENKNKKSSKKVQKKLALFLKLIYTKKACDWLIFIIHSQ